LSPQHFIALLNKIRTVVLDWGCEEWSIVCSCASCTKLKRCDICFTNDVVGKVSSTSEEALDEDNYP
jgi:hypothetical protein